MWDFLFNENSIHIFNAFWSYQPFELPWNFPSGMSTSQLHVFFIFEKNNSWVPSMLPVYTVVWRHLLGNTQPASGYISKEDWPHPLQVTITTVNARVQGPIKSEDGATQCSSPSCFSVSFLPLSGCSLSLSRVPCVLMAETHGYLFSVLWLVISLCHHHTQRTFSFSREDQEQLVYKTNSRHSCAGLKGKILHALKQLFLLLFSIYEWKIFLIHPYFLMIIV